MKLFEKINYKNIQFSLFDILILIILFISLIYIVLLQINKYNKNTVSFIDDVEYICIKDICLENPYFTECFNLNNNYLVELQKIRDLRQKNIYHIYIIQTNKVCGN